MLGPDAAIARLAEGHARFLSHLRADRGPARPAPVRPPNQHRSTGPATGPNVAIVTWPDVRYSVHALFDLALGDPFIIPSPPGEIAPAAIGSVDFAACRLGCPLIVFLGRIPYAPSVHELPSRPAAPAHAAHVATATPAPKQVRADHSATAAARPHGPQPEPSHGTAMPDQGRRAGDPHRIAAQPARPAAIAVARTSDVDLMRVVPTPAGLDPEMQVRHCLHHNIQTMLEYSACIRERISDGRLRIVAAAVEVRTGDLHWLGGHPQEAAIIAACNLRANQTRQRGRNGNGADLPTGGRFAATTPARVPADAAARSQPAS